MPKAALSDRKLMISDFSGSTTEPVIRNSTTTVSTHTIAATSGRPFATAER